MPNPLLRHYVLPAPEANTWTPVGTAPDAGRALAISKVTVTNLTAGTIVIEVAVSTGTTPVAGTAVAFGVSVGPGEVYTETGLVALEGERVMVHANAASAVTVNVFGEELDNA